jgi:hypothetical protein
MSPKYFVKRGHLYGEFVSADWKALTDLLKGLHVRDIAEKCGSKIDPEKLGTSIPRCGRVKTHDSFPSSGYPFPSKLPSLSRSQT